MPPIVYFGAGISTSEINSNVAAMSELNLSTSWKQRGVGNMNLVIL